MLWYCFYIGHKTVIAVAHNFKGYDNWVVNNMLFAKYTIFASVFVAAMIGKHNLEGKNYGIDILDVYIRPQYLKKKEFFYQHDICIAKIVHAT